MIIQCATKFDRHQFEKRPKACTAESHITFNDYSRMHVMSKRVHKYFRGAAPEWVINDHKFREVVVRYLEQRNYIAPQPHKSYEERLAAVDAAARKNYLPRYRALLDRLVNKSVSPVEVQNVDTKIVLEERGFAAIVVAVAYGYYRRGLNSVELANELGMKPPHVRILLYRLRAVAHQIESGESNGKRVVTFEVRDQVRELYKNGHSIQETAQRAGVSGATVRLLLKRDGLTPPRQRIKHETYKKAAERCVQCAQTARPSRVLCQERASKAAVHHRELRQRKAEVRDQIRELYNKGLTVSETAHQAGVAYCTARTLLKREGLLVRRQAKHETRKEFYDRLKAAGRCVQCAETARSRRILCQECASKAAVHHRERRQRKADAQQLFRGKPRGRHKPLPKEQVLAMYGAGQPTKQIAQEVGATHSGVWQFLRREGVLVRRQAKRETSKEFYDRMKAAGLCVQCGQTARQGRIHCQDCACKAVIRAQELREQKAAAKQLVTEAAQKLVEGARGGNDSNSLCPS